MELAGAAPAVCTASECTDWLRWLGDNRWAAGPQGPSPSCVAETVQRQLSVLAAFTCTERQQAAPSPLALLDGRARPDPNHMLRTLLVAWHDCISSKSSPPTSVMAMTILHEDQRKQV